MCGLNVPSGGSFSYFVSFDVLNTPLIFTAANMKRKSNYKQLKNTMKSKVKNSYYYKYLNAQITGKSVPET